MFPFPLALNAIPFSLQGSETNLNGSFKFIYYTMDCAASAEVN